jgi:hypothetical protein
LLLGEPSLDRWIDDGGSGPQLLHLPCLRQSLPDLPPAARGSVPRLEVGNGTSVFGDTPMLIDELQLGCANSSDRIVRKHLNQHDPRLLRQRQTVITVPERKPTPLQPSRWSPAHRRRICRQHRASWQRGLSEYVSATARHDWPPPGVAVGVTSETMRAVVLERPGPPESLRVLRVPMPRPEPGWVRIRVEAFGLNRSELHTRLGMAEGVTLPRVLGIECAGVVDLAPGTGLRPGQQVVAMMGGMGRAYDGGYAEYTRWCRRAR